jgi:hypothetical protein
MLKNNVSKILEEYIRNTEDKILLLDYKVRYIKSVFSTCDNNVKDHFELLLKYFESMRELYIVKLRLLELICELFENNLIFEKDVEHLLKKIESFDISSEDISEIVTNVLDRLRVVVNNLCMLRKLYDTLRSYSNAELS